ncbi:rRNA pseudouridine synthase [Terrimonas sp.]|uniref:pseudouridine synthase n=1 Tax=Terrimonas sp. TaxID=1914338 RepID=UPI000D524E7F|nr:pseudouridine synthase [Terrimonas sp.]PVD52624.1 rRNA pseudouridine synthase [Terrimonas sp.]
MSKKAFDKFINKAESGAKKKERIRQEKKQVRAEKNAYFEAQKRLAKERRKQQSAISYQQPAVSGQPSAKGKHQSGASDQRPGAGKQKQVEKQLKANDKSPAFKNQRATTEAASKSQISNLPAGRQGQKSKISNDEMPLNKFIAWSGVCARREAADIVKAGKVTVNGKLVTEPPFRVSQADTIKVNGKKISLQKNLVYILLNKPKDYITTTDDPEGRKTVMDLVKGATTERVFPVGRLDRNTTGVLLLTNDGEVAQRLTHPKYEVKKIYEVRLDKPVTKQQLDTIASGITLEDGFIQPDSVAYADTKDRSVIGIEIHSGKNRIVRRIFEHLGFDVKNLDRVMYGIFTKKNVDRGKWRFLTEKEIRLLKHLNTSFSNKKSQHQ